MGFWLKLMRWLTRLPFTLTLLAMLGLGSWLTNTHSGDLPPHWLNRLGFAAIDLWLGRWERLLTSALVTSGGWVFWQAVGMIALAVGAAEWLAGTRRTIFTFLGVHLVTLLIESLLIAWPLHWFRGTQGAAFLVARDVGPSAGYFGCLGLTCARFSQKRWGQLVSLLIWGGLVWTLFQLPRAGQDSTVKFLADLAHLIAFPLGWLSVYVFRKKEIFLESLP